MCPKRCCLEVNILLLLLLLCGKESNYHIICFFPFMSWFVLHNSKQHNPLCLSLHSSVVSVNAAMRETKEALENVSVSLEVLQEGTGKLNFNLSLVRNNINRTLNDPGCHDEESDTTTAQLCQSIRRSLSQLQISANFTRV